MNEEINWRHPELQALLSRNARREIELSIIETILNNDPDEDYLTSMDMEYWYDIHDRILKLMKENKRLKNDMK